MRSQSTTKICSYYFIVNFFEGVRLPNRLFRKIVTNDRMPILSLQEILELLAMYFSVYDIMLAA